ncbi:MAG: S9 family peptidase [Verrucomicrobia bacterium]|nr:S9 family peptidase [Cytophagales bacterium]
MKKNLVVLLLLFTHVIFAQNRKPFTLEDIQKGTFYPQSVQGFNWMNDGNFYTAVENGSIVKYNVPSGKLVETLLKNTDLVPSGAAQAIDYDDYSFSQNESKMLFKTETEGIYRRSDKAVFFVYDLKTKQLQKLSTGKQSYATFSPDGSKVAFCRDNNLFVVNLADMSEKALTADGKFNFIINGSTDWVYEEEFSFVQAFAWSPAGDKIAYYSFNETEVKEYNMQVWGNLYPKDYKFKYPKAGEANSVVQIAIANLNTGKTTQVDLGKETDIYIPRMKWTNDNNLLSLKKMNRLQNTLEILHANATTGQTQVVWSETSDTYIDLEFTDDLTYLSKNQGFIQSSEKSGYKHVYFYDMSGKQIRQLTSGNWEVSNLLGIDEKTQTLYFTSTENSPLERQLYSINFSGKNKKRLSPEKGTHNPEFSKDFKYYLNYHSAANSPMKVSLYQADGKVIKVLETNEKLKTNTQAFAIPSKEFFNFNLPSGESLNGYLMKPIDFDANRKYPVLMYVYGGPGSQQVLDNWSYADWMQTLTQKGYIIACVDNRGTGARGKAFRTVTYANLGKNEVQDQIEAAKFLGNQAFVDKERIGIYGWSYGGYMTALCLTLGADVFKTGIVGAPVTNWRFYDSIYTERYLKTPQENAAGYDNFSPVKHADKFKGKMLLIHGTGDDNVHFQNSVAFADALVRAGKQFESFYYPNQAHGVRGYARTHLNKMMVNFVEKNL